MKTHCLPFCYTPHAFSLRFVKNTSALADARVNMEWKEGDQAFQPIPTKMLSPMLPTAAHTKMAAVQREQYAKTAGWGSWYPHNLLAATRLPDGATVGFGLCQLDTGDCELASASYSFDTRLGVHAADGSYAQLYHWYPGSKWDGAVNVSVSWGTQPPPSASSSSVTTPATASATALHDLRMTITVVECANPTNYAIVLMPSFSPVWSGVGVAAADKQASTMTITPANLPTSTFKVSGPALTHSQAGALNVSGNIPHLAFAVKTGSNSTTVTLTSIPNEAASATAAALAKAEAAERAKYASYGTPALAELKEAVQASVMWLTVYVPYATGLILTLSRGSMGGGNSQCDWDNFFCSNDARFGCCKQCWTIVGICDVRARAWL